MFIEKAYAAENIISVPSGLFANGPKTTAGDIANGILSLLTSLAYPLAFLALLYTAYILVSSLGKPEAYTTAKKNITYVVIGIFLIVFAVAMVRFVTGLFSLPTPTP